ncbi:uncharacterized protein LOC121986839 [Zingiber officinale]|uniref:uncharacterized protein LOC121986839 n=1 Tax=Zingiber officinale TaxID=94328 RepID=UPI001C4B4012|nr:uncharacterized protein LOC121986839 [Zingiber officinale]
MARRETSAAAPTNSRLVRRGSGEERRARRLAETAGETAAECAAICCCCPCGVAKLVVVVAVKLPARLVRRTLQRSRAPSSRKKAPAIARQELVPAGDHPEEAFPARSPAEAMSELEKVMRANFYGAGFWRSLSQRERSSPKC